jgi:hypothetical protein
MFSGNLALDLDDSYHSTLESDNSPRLLVNAKEQKDSMKKTMHTLTIPQFLRYFKISDRENDFFEEMITKLSVLT